MPPHCDSLDGPVVTAAAHALAAGDVELVLPYVPAEGEDEVEAAFEDARAARTLGPAAREVADRWFFETVVRVHREGEGAPYTGLKPAGMDVGPVIPLAERAIAFGSPDELVDLLTSELAREVQRRLAGALHLQASADSDVPAAREYVEAMLGFEVWAHSVHEALRSRPHEHAHV